MSSPSEDFDARMMSLGRFVYFVLQVVIAEGSFRAVSEYWLPKTTAKSKKGQEKTPSEGYTWQRRAEFLCLILLVVLFFEAVRMPRPENNSPIDGEKFLETKLKLGKGLALNYWYALLESYNDGPPPTVEVKGREQVLQKFVLIPRSCNFVPESLGEGIEILDEKTDYYAFHPKRYYENLRNEPITAKVMMVTVGDRTHRVVFDFPRTLQSSMGPKKDINNCISDRHRQACLKDFVKKIRQLMNRSGRSTVKIIVYDDRKPNFNLAIAIDDFLTQELNEVISSSESEAEY